MSFIEMIQKQEAKKQEEEAAKMARRIRREGEWVRVVCECECNKSHTVYVCISYLYICVWVYVRMVMFACMNIYT